MMDETVGMYDCRAIQRAAWLTPGSKGRWGLNLNWTGSVGTAKSAMIESLAREVGLQAIVVLLGQREPADLLGIPIPDGNGFMRYCAPDFARKANDAPGAVIYLDEANYATPAVQGAAQRMILEGVVGDLALEPSVRFVMSMNPMSQAMSAGGQELSTAFANRMGHIPWIAPGVQQWSEWMLADAGDSPAEMGNIVAQQKRVLKMWPAAWAKARAAVTTFLRSHQSLLNIVPAPRSPDASGAFPTPRTWELATRAIASAEVHGLDPESARVFCAAFIGTDACNEYLSWREKNDLPDPEKILNREIEFSHNPRRLDVTMATLTAITTIMLDEEPDGKDFDKRLNVLWDTLCAVAPQAPDLVHGPVIMVSRSKKTKLLTGKHDGARTLLLKMAPMISMVRHTS